MCRRASYCMRRRTLEIPAALLPDALAALPADEAVVVEPLPAAGRAVYLAGLHNPRPSSRDGSKISSGRPARCRRSTWIKRCPGRGEDRLALTEEQRQAVRLAFQEKLLIFTGGPGTGKTTILQEVIRLLEAKRLRMHLASPTGRAAKRLAEVTGHEASTLHRLLEWNPREGKFQRKPGILSRPMSSSWIKPP